MSTLIDKPYRRHTDWPTPERGHGAVVSVMCEAAQEGFIGFDCEFIPNTLEGRIFGVASKNRCASDWWNPDFCRHLWHLHKPIVAYSYMGADKPVLERYLGFETSIECWSDPMMRWFIMNSDMASIPKSSFDEDTEETGAIGFMNIWAATSMIHDIPQWKRCMGRGCAESGRPCPEHNEPDYCAVDAWAGLVDDYTLRELML